MVKKKNALLFPLILYLNLPASPVAGPIHEAAKVGNINTLRGLIRGGADANELDERGYSPLFWAIQRKHMEAVRYLVANGDGDRADLSQSIYGQNYLYIAVRMGVEAAPISEFLLNEAFIAYIPTPEGVPIVNAVSSTGQTALTMALGRDDHATASLLLEHGIDPNLGRMGESGMTPLCDALYWGRPASLVENLVFAGAKIDAHHNRWPCLAFATRGGDVTALNVLLFGGANLATTFLPSGLSIYYDAVQSAGAQGPIDVVKALVESGRGVNINEIHDAGDDLGRMTALDHAIRVGNTAMEDYLGGQGALSAFEVHGASLEFFMDLIGGLEVDYGQFREMDVNMRSSRGHSLVHFAVAGEDLEMMEALLAYGANPDLPDTSGMSPLHYAASFESTDMAQTLIDAGATVCLPEPLGGATALHVAVGSENIPMVELLLSHGACVDAVTDAEGWTPLHIAGQIGSVEAASLLLEAGADADILDGSDPGLTVWDLADSVGNTSFRSTFSR